MNDILWAKFHTGFWHAYQAEALQGKRLRSACGVATTSVEDLLPYDAVETRWSCRQCGLELSAQVEGTQLGR